jgi:hypothetical protein
LLEKRAPSVKTTKEQFVGDEIGVWSPKRSFFKKRLKQEKPQLLDLT